jgi:hypothetical protein
MITECNSDSNSYKGEEEDISIDKSSSKPSMSEEEITDSNSDIEIQQA